MKRSLDGFENDVAAPTATDYVPAQPAARGLRRFSSRPAAPASSPQQPPSGQTAPAKEEKSAAPQAPPAPPPSAAPIPPPAASVPKPTATEPPVNNPQESPSEPLRPAAGQGSSAAAGQGSAALQVQPLDVDSLFSHVDPDVRATARALRSKLKQLDPEFSKTNDKVQVTLLLLRETDKAIEALRLRYRISKGMFLSAAAAVWLQEFERAYGQPISLDPAQLTGLMPNAADRIMTTIIRFQEDPTVTVNSALPSVYNTKLKHAIYLLDTLGRKTSKRVVMGSSAIKLFDQLLKSI
jgi:hypothetical protein